MDNVLAALESYVTSLHAGIDHENGADGEHAYEVAYYRLHLAQSELLREVLDEGGLEDPRIDAWLKLEKRAHAASYLPDAEGERAEVAFLNLAQALQVARGASGFSAQ